MDETHGLAALIGALIPPIVAGLTKVINGLFELACLKIERQKVRAQKKTEKIASDE